MRSASLRGTGQKVPLFLIQSLIKIHTNHRAEVGGGKGITAIGLKSKALLRGPHPALRDGLLLGNFDDLLELMCKKTQNTLN